MNRYTKSSGTAAMGILGGLIGLAAASAALGAWSGTSADYPISADDNEYARGVQIAFDDGTGDLHAVWSEDAPSLDEIHYGRSADLGATWSSAGADHIISLPDGNAAYEEAAIAIGNDLIVVLWSEDYLATREVHYGISTNRGTTFSSETADLVLSDVSTEVDSGIPSVLIADDNAIHVVWQQVVEGSAEVHYSRSTDHGATWSGTSADRVISFSDSNGAITPKLMKGAGGRLLVVWREAGEVGKPVIHLGISDDGGDSWSSETADREISPPVNLMTNLDAAGAPWGFESDGTAWVVFTGSLDTASPFHYEAYGTHSTDNGTTWSGESTLVPVSYDETHTRSASNPDIFYSLCAGAIAAWDEEEDDAGTNEQHVSFFGHGVWSGANADEIVSFPDGEDGYRPSIAGVQTFVIVPDAAAGEVPSTWVAWTEFIGDATDNYEVHLSGESVCSAASAPVPGEAVTELWAQASPNPAHDRVRLRIGSPTPDQSVHLEIFDPGGRSLRRWDSRLNGSGRLDVEWDARDQLGRLLPAGVYLVRVTNGEGHASTPVVMLR